MRLNETLLKVYPCNNIVCDETRAPNWQNVSGVRLRTPITNQFDDDKISLATEHGSVPVLYMIPADNYFHP